MTYTEISNYFGSPLSSDPFQDFLKTISCDPASYNVAKSSYITSKDGGIEIGFKNDDAEFDDDEEIVFKEGTPVFSVVNLYPRSSRLISGLPFEIDFSDTLAIVRKKAGTPVKITDFNDKLFGKRFLIDHFKIGDLAVSIDYNPETETIAHIQIRDNEQAEAHLKL